MRARTSGQRREKKNHMGCIYTQCCAAHTYYMRSVSPDPDFIYALSSRAGTKWRPPRANKTKNALCVWKEQNMHLSAGSTYEKLRKEPVWCCSVPSIKLPLLSTISAETLFLSLSPRERREIRRHFCIRDVYNMRSSLCNISKLVFCVSINNIFIWSWIHRCRSFVYIYALSWNSRI